MKRLFGGILLAVGILIMTGSGLCSLAVIFGMPGALNTTALLLPLIIGGVPFGLGFGLFYVGKNLMRRPKSLNEDELNDRFS